MPENDRPEPSRAQLEAWVLSTLPRAVAFALSLLRDRASAEDVVHDCYVRLLQKADVYDLIRDGTKLLFKSVTNACLDRNQRERIGLSLDRAVEGDLAMHIPLADPNAETPVQAVEQKELEDVVASALSQLPAAQRAALELKSLGYSIGRVAESLGTSTSNAGVLIHRARKALALVVANYMGRPLNE